MEQLIPIAKIVKGKNPRTHMDPEKLQELAWTIKERGLIQTITVEPHKRGTFLLVGGESLDGRGNPQNKKIAYRYSQLKKIRAARKNRRTKKHAKNRH